MAKKKSYEEQMETFINQMREVGVSDKTIKQVLKEIKQYQEKMIEAQLKEMHNRFSEVLKEKMIGNE